MNLTSLKYRGQRFEPNKDNLKRVLNMALRENIELEKAKLPDLDIQGFMVDTFMREADASKINDSEKLFAKLMNPDIHFNI